MCFIGLLIRILLLINLRQLPDLQFLLSAGLS